MCLETVEGARPSNSVTWQTQSSPPEDSASRARTRFSSDSAAAIARSPLTRVSYISPYNEI